MSERNTRTLDAFAARAAAPRVVAVPEPEPEAVQPEPQPAAEPRKAARKQASKHGTMVERPVIDTAAFLTKVQARARAGSSGDMARKPVNVSVEKPLADALGIFAALTGTKRVDIIQEFLVHMLRDWEGNHMLPEGWDRGEQ